MTLAEELLTSLSDDEVALYTAEPEVEGHFVVDVDRFITVPESLKKLAVQYDHNVETVTFDCPRYWDGIDMSGMRIYINYSRADKGTGCYKVTNVCIDESDDSIMHFDWTVRGHVTEVPGTISFLVCIKRVDEEGNEENHWNSELCSECYISKGLECDETFLDQYPDIISQWDEQVEKAIEKLESSVAGDTTEMVDKVNASIDELTETVDTKTAEMTMKVDDAIANMESTVSSTNAELTAKVNEAIAGIDSTTTELTTKVDNAIANLESTTESTTTELTTKVDNAIASLESTTESTTTELTTKVDSAIANLESTAASTNTELANKVDTAIANMESTASAKTAEMVETVDSKTAEMTSKVDTAIADMTATATATNEDLLATKQDLLDARDSGEFNGATFTPSVSDDGDLSWSNDKGLANPEPVNIKGNPGDNGVSPTISVTTISGGHRITITDKEGIKTIDVMDGKTDVTEAAIELLNKFVFIGDTEPASGPVLWFDTSARVSIEDNVIMLELGGEGDVSSVTATLNGTEYPVMNASDPTEVDGETVEITIT